jgi:flagellar biosynthesis protein FliR
MSWPLEMLIGRHDLCVFALVLSRLAGLVIGAPMLVGLRVPWTVRALVVISLALVIAPTQVGALAESPPSVMALALLVGAELLVGLLLGLGVSVTIAGLQLAGSIVSQLSGMSLAEAFDPCFESDVPLLAQFLTVLAIALFLLMGGHRLMIDGLLESFAAMPPGGAVVDARMIEVLLSAVGDGFALAVRAAAPAVAALLVASLTLGALSRALPQLSTMALGFGLNVFAALGGLWLSLGTIAYLFEEQVRTVLENILDVVGA